MIVTGNHIDRFVNAYNAYRAWERQGSRALTLEAPLEAYFDGENVARPEDLPATAREGQNYFVGDWSQRNGEFYVFRDGQWNRGGP
jgi:hypothetical protein